MDGQLQLVPEDETRVCVGCGVEKPVGEFWWSNERRVPSRLRWCGDCSVRERSLRFGVPERFLHLIRVPNANTLCVSGEVVRDVLRTIGVESKKGLGRLVGKDEASVRRLFTQEWVSEKKLDEILTALHCNHLWFDHPGLAECHEAILEFESSRMELAEVAA